MARVVVGSAIVGVVTIVTMAPALLAEVFLDAVLVTALYQRMKHIDRRWWLGGAMRQTWYPVLLTALTLMIAGFIMHSYVPTAVSIGEVRARYRSLDESVER